LVPDKEVSIGENLNFGTLWESVWRRGKGGAGPHSVQSAVQRDCRLIAQATRPSVPCAAPS